MGYLRSCGLLGLCRLSGRLDSRVSRASRMGFLVREQVLPGRYLEVFSGGSGRFVEIIFLLFITFLEQLYCVRSTPRRKEKRRKKKSLEKSGAKRFISNYC